LDTKTVLDVTIEWLNEPRGKGLLWEESRLVSKVLDEIFGDYLLQIGAWGAPDQFLKAARTRSSYLISETEVGWSSVVSSTAHLGIASDSIDAILLPHTLETAQDQHQLLREIERILRPDGQLIVLGFNSPGWWPLRQRLSDGGFLSGIDQFVGESRLEDWLQLLGFTTTQAQFYHPAKSVDRLVANSTSYIHENDSLIASGWWRQKLLRGPEEQRGLLRRLRSWRYWRITSACYMMVARKDVATLTPIRERRFRRPRLVGGLVNPSTRASAGMPPTK
jgi:SAM-dependent methyltransferase